MSRSLFITSIVLILSACTSTEDIKGRDNTVFTPAFRASTQLLPYTPSPYSGSAASDTPPAPARRAKFHLFLDFDLATGQGDSDQSVGTGKNVEYGDATIAGPATVEHEYTLTVASAAGRAGWLFGDRFALEGLLGLGLTSLDMEVSSGSTSDDDSTTGLGALIGMQLAFYLRPDVAIEARFSSLANTNSDEATVLDAYETVVKYRAASDVDLFAGWRWWDLEQERSDGDSDVFLKISGPTLGVQLRF